MADQGIGASVQRKEDFRFLTGRGTYTDDINRHGQTHAYILRSPHASAKIKSVDTAKAKQAPGVVAILSGADYAARPWSSPLTRRWWPISCAISAIMSPWSSPRPGPRPAMPPS